MCFLNSFFTEENSNSIIQLIGLLILPLSQSADCYNDKPHVKKKEKKTMTVTEVTVLMPKWIQERSLRFKIYAHTPLHTCTHPTGGWGEGSAGKAPDPLPPAPKPKALKELKVYRNVSAHTTRLICFNFILNLYVGKFILKIVFYLNEMI